MSFLDDLPHASPLAYVVIALALIAYLNNDMSSFQAIVAAALGTGGAGLLGHARNGAGRGIRK